MEGGRESPIITLCSSITGEDRLPSPGSMGFRNTCPRLFLKHTQPASAPGFCTCPEGFPQKSPPLCLVFLHTSYLAVGYFPDPHSPNRNHPPTPPLTLLVPCPALNCSLALSNIPCILLLTPFIVHGVLFMGFSRQEQ